MTEPTVDLLPHEVLELVNETKGHDAKIALLQEHKSFALCTILQVNYNESITLDLPYGKAPYTPDPSPAGYNLTRINKSIKVLAQLTPNSKLSKPKKEMKFIQFLEAIHAEDAKVILAMKDKKIIRDFPGVTLSVVKKAYPKIFVDKE